MVTVKRQSRKTPRKKAGDLELAPHSVEAEEALLGALLASPAMLDSVRGDLNVADFFILRHGWIYAAMLRLADRHDAIDVRMLAGELKAHGQFEDAGGENYLNYLLVASPSSLHAPVYAAIVRRMAVRRQMLQAAGEVAAIAQDYELEIEEVIDRAQAAIFGVAREQRRSIITFERALSQVYDDMEAERDGRPGTIQIATPWRDLNRLIGGIEGKQLIIPAARPGCGKSAMMLQMATCAARQNLHVLICSLEMSEREIISRVIAQETGVPTNLQRRMDDQQWRTFLDWVASRSAPLHQIILETGGGITPLKLAALARDMRRRGTLDMIIVDYLQLMQDDNRHSENRNAELGSITRALKQLAMELDVPVVAASQLNREATRGGQRPRLHHLRDSGALEADANMVIFIHDPEPEDEAGDGLADGPKRFIVAKNRNGPTGEVPVVWLGERMLFGDLQKGVINYDR